MLTVLSTLIEHHDLRIVALAALVCALSAFAGKAEPLARAVQGRPVVLTPHLGEFRGLVPDLAAGAAVDPWHAAAAASERLGTTVLLKGVPTVIAAPGAPPVTVASGNPGLATGGSGDTLSGLIATFLAQGLPPESAAPLGAHVMGSAADLAENPTSSSVIVVMCTSPRPIRSAQSDASRLVPSRTRADLSMSQAVTARPGS